jgi:branched-chain amino acid transport system substrate-binding protein
VPEQIGREAGRLPGKLEQMLFPGRRLQARRYAIESAHTDSYHASTGSRQSGGMMKADKSAHTQSQGRRQFVGGLAGLAGSALLGRAPVILAQTRAPLRIGVLNSFSKVFAALGTANLNAMTLYIEQQGGVIAGRKVEIIREDDEVNPQVGLQKLRKLVESDKCDVITGIQASNVALACVDYIRQSKTFFLCSGAGVSDLSYTGIPYLFRCSIATQPIHATFGEWFYDNVAKEAIATASDFAGGRNTIGEFKAGFSKKGGKIVKEVYPPLGNNDFSPYLADIRSMAPTPTFNFYAGTDAVRFVKQYDEYGLKGSSRETGSGFMVESDTLPAQGKSALGIMSSLHYADTLDNAANKKFVAGYRAKFNEFPSVYAEYGWVAAQVLQAAIQTVNGDTQNKDKLRDAMRVIRLDAPRGPFRFNPATQSPIQNVYIREVAEVDGRITNRVVQTYKDVVEPATKTG